MTSKQKLEELQASSKFSQFEVELDCGDLNSITAELFVDYYIEKGGYYGGKLFINNAYLFASLGDDGALCDVTNRVSSDLIDDLLSECINLE